MITAAELGAMRTTLLDSLPDLAYVLRRQVASDGAGGQTQTYPAPSDPGVPSYPCRLTVMSDTERHTEDITVERVTGTTAWIATLPALADVVLTDRLSIGGRVYEVSFVIGPLTWEITRRVLCREIT